MSRGKMAVPLVGVQDDRMIKVTALQFNIKVQIVGFFLGWQ